MTAFDIRNHFQLHYGYYLQLADQLEESLVEEHRVEEWSPSLIEGVEQGTAELDQRGPSAVVYSSISDESKAACFFFVLDMANSLSTCLVHMMKRMDIHGPLSQKLAEHSREISRAIQQCSEQCTRGEISIDALVSQMKPPEAIIGCIQSTIIGMRDFQRGIPMRDTVCKSPRLYAFYLVERHIIKALFFIKKKVKLNIHLQSLKNELHAVALAYLTEKISHEP